MRPDPLQGIAAGLASGPIGAALIDLQPPGSQRAPLMTSVFSTLGLALGALITSTLVQYAPAPTHLIWWTLLAVFAVSILTVLAMAEPGSRRPGVLASLRPQVAVPRQARGTFAGAVPCIVAGWALGGLYLSLGPSLAAAATGSPNLLWGGLVIFLLCGTGAAAAFALRSVSPRVAVLAGCLCLFAGMAVTFGAIVTTTATAFLAGTAIAGVGFGLAFQGSFRMITALAEPDDRAGLVAAIYIVGYLAFSVPALIAGVATTTFGLHSTALVYSASLAVLAAAAVGILLACSGGKPSRLASAKHALMPPGPCTTPPCPQVVNQPDGSPGNDRRTDQLRGGSSRLRLQLSDLLTGRSDKFLVGVRVTAQPPPAGHGLGQEHPDAAGERRVVSGVRDHAGELAHYRDLLVAVEGARVGQHLHANVVGRAVDVRQVACGQLVDEGGRVLAEHRDVRNLFDGHQSGREISSELVLVGECARCRVHVDHGHCVVLPAYVPQRQR